jgi:hypothetical protein
MPRVVEGDHRPEELGDFGWKLVEHVLVGLELKISGCRLACASPRRELRHQEI